jgi:hypothetical protein
MRLIFAIVFMVFIGSWNPPGSGAAEHAPKTEDVEKTRVGAYDFRLTGRELFYASEPDSGSMTLDVSGPCRLHRNNKGEVRTVETKSGTVFLIECSTVQPRSPEGVRRLCKTTIRGVVVKSHGVTLSDKWQTVSMCPPFEWDEKMYRFFVE